MVKKHRNVDFDLGRLTAGERLWLARKAAGLTQVKAAKRAGVGENAYAGAEKDLNAAVRGPVPGIPAVRRPTMAQMLALARRRSGLGLRGLAKAGSVTKVTVLAWERAGRPELVRFWEKRGFTFPR